MKKAFGFVFLAAGILALSAGCVPQKLHYDSAYRNEGKGIVVMHDFYEEAAPFDGLFAKGVRTRKYYSYALLRHRATGKRELIGQVTGSGYASSAPYERFSFTGLPPGRYDVVGYGIGGIEADYDSQKCGHISFDVDDTEIVVVKGLKPLSIAEGGIFKLGRIPNYVAFETLPPDYEHFINENHSDAASGRSIRVADLASDNPAAFDKCVKEGGGKFSTLSREEGAVPVKK